MKLAECLRRAPYPALLRISRHYGVVIGHDCRRAALLERVGAAPLLGPITAELRLARQGPTRDALDLLARASGSCDRRYFERCFGSCIVARSGIIPADPPAAWLAARGLIFAVDATVTLPEELLALIPRAVRQEPLPALLDDPRPLYDLAVLLVAAHHGSLVLDGRGARLRRRVVLEVGRCCSTPAPPERVHFLVDLARAAGLLETDGAVLRPGSTLGSWIARDAGEQLRTLWQTWSVLSIERGRTQRTQPCRDCPWLRDALVARLRAAADAVRGDPGNTVSVAPDHLMLLHLGLPCVLEGSCRVCDMPADARATDPALALVAGPLHWLGIIGVATPDDDALSRLVLTSQGATMLGVQASPTPTVPPWRCEPVDLMPGRRTPPYLTVSPESTCAALFRLGSVADPLPSLPFRWQIIPARLARLAREGGQLEALLTFLDQHTRAPLPSAWRLALEEIAQTRILATITPALLLESPVPLPPTRPPLSSLLHRTLSSRAAVVYPRSLSALQQALERQGIDLLMEPAQPGIDLPPASATMRPGDYRIALGVALRLLQALDARGFPAPPQPIPLSDAVLAVSEEERTAIGLWTQRLLGALDAALERESTPAPGPPERHTVPALADSDAVRTTITHALARNLHVGLRNTGAGRQDSHWRLVEPHRLEQRLGCDYLRAYCYLRRDERLFRLDRISACEPALFPPTSAPPPVPKRAAPQAEDRRTERVRQGE